MWLGHGGWAEITAGRSGFFVGLAQLTGLYASLLALAGITIAARPAMLERRVGLDRALGWHRRLGGSFTILAVLHTIVSVVAYADVDQIGVVHELGELLTHYRFMVPAAIGTGMLVVIAVSSMRALRRRLSYETWYFIHLNAYFAVALAFGHQLTAGSDLVSDHLARAYWIALHLAVLGVIVWSRIGGLVRSIGRQQLRVDAVVPESPDTVSIYLGGPQVANIRAEAGQFFMLRVLKPGLWWQTHPFSLSAAPDRSIAAVHGEATRRRDRGDDFARRRDASRDRRTVRSLHRVEPGARPQGRTHRCGYRHRTAAGDTRNARRRRGTGGLVPGAQGGGPRAPWRAEGARRGPQRRGVALSSDRARSSRSTIHSAPNNCVTRCLTSPNAKHSSAGPSRCCKPHARDCSAPVCPRPVCIAKGSGTDGLAVSSRAARDRARRHRWRVARALRPHRGTHRRHRKRTTSTSTAAAPANTRPRRFHRTDGQRHRRTHGPRRPTVDRPPPPDPPAACSGAETLGPVVQTVGPGASRGRDLAGRICDVRAVVVPSSHTRSAAINSRAVPVLRQRVLDAQSAAFDTVSGATVTSDGYRSSLQAILNAAK